MGILNSYSERLFLKQEKVVLTLSYCAATPRNSKKRDDFECRCGTNGSLITAVGLFVFIEQVFDFV